MAHRHGKKLLGAYAPREFADAVGALAEAAGKSRSAFLREALADRALSLAASKRDRDG